MFSKLSLFAVVAVANAQTTSPPCDAIDVSTCGAQADCAVEEAQCEGDFEAYLGCLIMNWTTFELRGEGDCTGQSHPSPESSKTGLECYWFGPGLLEPVFGPGGLGDMIAANGGGCLGPPDVLFGCGVGDSTMTQCEQKSAGCKWSEESCDDADNACEANANENDCIAVDGCYWSDASGSFDLKLPSTTGADTSATETIKPGCKSCFVDQYNTTAGEFNEYLWFKDLGAADCTLSGGRAGIVTSISGAATVGYVNAGAGSCATGTPGPPGDTFGMVIDCTPASAMSAGVLTAASAMAVFPLALAF